MLPAIATSLNGFASRHSPTPKQQQQKTPQLLLLKNYVHVFLIFKHSKHRDVPNQMFQGSKPSFHSSQNLHCFPMQGCQKHILSKNKLLVSKCPSLTNQQSRNTISNECDSLHYKAKIEGLQ